MAERKGSGRAYIAYQPQELIIMADGSQVVIGTAEIFGTSRKVRAKALASFLEETGAEVLGSVDGASGPLFFSTSRLKTPWNSGGSNSDWLLDPPAEPSLN